MTTLSSIALNHDYDIAVKDNGGGLSTIQIACDHRAVYQLIRTGLLAKKLNREIENPFWIDWDLFLKELDIFGADEAYRSILSIQILALINGFEGVESVDISNADISQSLNRNVSITGICPRISCSHRSDVCEINI